MQKVWLKATMTERPQPEDSLENEKNDNNKTNTHKKQQMIQKCAKTYRL